MMKLGTKAPAFSLLDSVSDKTVSLSEIKSDVATVVVFICNHCPFVKHINPKLVEVANTYKAKGDNNKPAAVALINIFLLVMNILHK